MKRKTRDMLGTILALVTVGLVVCAPAEAIHRGPFDGPADKLGRGISNLFLGWFEIPWQAANGIERDEPLAGFVTGLGRGLTLGLLRTAVGVYETVTFPIAVPRYYSPMMEKPQWWRWRALDDIWDIAE